MDFKKFNIINGENFSGKTKFFNENKHNLKGTIIEITPVDDCDYAVNDNDGINVILHKTMSEDNSFYENCLAHVSEILNVDVDERYSLVADWAYYIVSTCFSLNENEVLYIDKPETYLDNNSQKRLMEFLYKISENNQIFIETNSDAIVDALSPNNNFALFFTTKKQEEYKIKNINIGNKKG